MQAILVEEGITFDNNSVYLFFSFPLALVFALVRPDRLECYRRGIVVHAVAADVSLRAARNCRERCLFVLSREIYLVNYRTPTPLCIGSGSYTVRL